MKRALVLLAMLFAVAGSVTGQAGAAGTSTKGTERLQALEQDILSRLNEVRSEHSLKPLALSNNLRSAAVAHSRAMLDQGFFEHDSNDGTLFSERLKRFYRASGYSSWSVGENLLYSTAEIDAQASIDAWLESPGHRANMLAPNWREVGIGALHAAAAGGTFGGEPTWVITMDFGARVGGTDYVRLVTKTAKARAEAARARAAKAKAARARAAKTLAAQRAKIVVGVASPPPSGAREQAPDDDAGSSDSDVEHDPGYLDLIGRIFGVYENTDETSDLSLEP